MERIAFTLKIKEKCEEDYDRSHLPLWPGRGPGRTD